MSIGRHRRAPLAISLALLACAAGCQTLGAAGGSATAGAPAAPVGFSIIRQAESVPIAALAFRAPFLWAGTEHGLRRWNVQTEDAEWIGASIGLLGRSVSALAIDGQGGVWVATEAGVGRITQAGAQLRYEPKGALGAVTSLLATRDDGGVWGGGPGGLYRLDGQSWTIVDFLRDVPVTSLDLDADGTSVWVGTQGQGLLRVDRKGGKPVLQPADAGGAEQIVGTAMSPGDVRIVAGRAADGGRVVFLTRQGPEVYRTQADAKIRIVRVLGVGKDAVLIAGPEGAERIYTFAPLARGESPPPGGFRLIGVGAAVGNRYAAVPMPLGAPPDVTAVTTGDAPGELWLGSRTMGVARAGKKGPVYLPGAELTGDADRMTVACAARAHCYVVAGGDRAWLFDGARFREARVGEVDGGRALAVVADRSGALLAVSSDPKLAGLVLTRLKTAGVAGKPDDWQPLDRIALDIPVGSPSVSFTAFAPDGRLWLGLGVLDAAGQEQGRGAVEIDLASHKVIQHGSGFGSVGAAHPDPESLPLPHDMMGILFDGTATWFAARSGVSRWQESELRRWGENERMGSEVCYAVAKGPGGAIWAATSAGVGLFEGKQWRFADADDEAAVPTRALLKDGAGRIWLATSKGLRVLPATGDAARAPAPRASAGDVVVDGDMLDATIDRYGRVWALGATSLAVVDARGDGFK